MGSSGQLRVTNPLGLQNSTVNLQGTSTTSDFVNFYNITSSNYTFGGLEGVGPEALISKGSPANVAIALTVGGNGQSTTYDGALGQYRQPD